jgi:hypothetical protein
MVGMFHHSKLPIEYQQSGDELIYAGVYRDRPIEPSTDKQIEIGYFLRK